MTRSILSRAMSQLGKRKSPRKTAAARENGKRGGRPVQQRQFFTRGGKRVSEAAVMSAKQKTAEMYRTGAGAMPGFILQPRVADSISRMTLVQFCRWSGTFKYA